MDLLFRRSQTASVFHRITFGLRGRVRFKLWGKVAFDDEEKALVERYQLDKAMLIKAIQPGLRRKAFWVGTLWFLLFCIYLFNAANMTSYLSYFYYMTFGYAVRYLVEAFYFFDIYEYSFEAANTLLSAIIGFGVGYWHYHQKRETIYVRDLIHGRYFVCDSVIDLARKEAWLETIWTCLKKVDTTFNRFRNTDWRNIWPTRDIHQTSSVKQ